MSSFIGVQTSNGNIGSDDAAETDSGVGSIIGRPSIKGIGSSPFGIGGMIGIGGGALGFIAWTFVPVVALGGAAVVAGGGTFVANKWRLNNLKSALTDVLDMYGECCNQWKQIYNQTCEVLDSQALEENTEDLLHDGFEDTGNLMDHTMSVLESAVGADNSVSADKLEHSMSDRSSVSSYHTAQEQRSKAGSVILALQGIQSEVAADAESGCDTASRMLYPSHAVINENDELEEGISAGVFVDCFQNLADVSGISEGV